ncbi:MAG: NOP58 family protein [Candidatus Aenigmarchaeota archaeon]|nr:NOP58 family protein [Candidatus Aenigmarchaeota archaeon]
MKARSPIGIFEFDEKGIVRNIELFEKDPEKAAEYFIQSADDGQDQMRENFRAYALKHFSEEDLNAFISEFCIALSKKMMSGAVGKDKLIIQASNALEELVKISNTLLMRTAEWFSLHYPECKKNNETLAEYIAKYGRRENWPEFKGSLGVEISEEDETVLKTFASLAYDAHEQKKRQESYVKIGMKKVAPNFASLMEPLLAARFLAAAGSMEKLAKMSSSSIQLLGAEKALFRHLRNKGRSPKYGMIYVSNLVQSVPEDKRGKAARAYATKLMLAARIDYFSGRDESAKIKKELEDEIKIIKG